MSAENRPTWLPDDCPSWCAWSEHHQEYEPYASRLHFDRSAIIPLTAEEPYPNGAWDSATIDIEMCQHYREVDPRIQLRRDGLESGTQLTLDEAERLAQELLARVAIARGAE